MLLKMEWVWSQPGSYPRKNTVFYTCALTPGLTEVVQSEYYEQSTLIGKKHPAFK